MHPRAGSSLVVAHSPQRACKVRMRHEMAYGHFASESVLSLTVNNVDAFIIDFTFTQRRITHKTEEYLPTASFSSPN
jgi:hypothetical protein